MKETTTIITIAIILAIACGYTHASLYGPKSKVIQLDKNNFAEKVYGSEHVWMVEFYAPWCGHCKALTPEYEKAATNLEGLVRIGAVNCDDKSNQEICGSFGVKGFPTIKLFPSKMTQVPNKKGAVHKVPEDYQGARTAPAIASFALSKLPNYVVPVSSKSFDEFVKQQIPKAILFTNKPKTSDLFKALAIDYRNRMILGEVKHSDSSLVEKYKVTEFPALIVINEDGTSTPYSMPAKPSHSLISSFLDGFALPPPKPTKSNNKDTKDTKDKSSSPAPPPPPPESGEIYEVRNQTAFDAAIKGLSFLAFLDNENMNDASLLRYITVLKAIGEKYKGKVRIVYMDGPTQTPLVTALDSSSNFPSAVLVNLNSKRAVNYISSFSEAGISEFLDAVLASGQISRKSQAIPDPLPPIAPQSLLFGERPKYEEEGIHDEL